MAESFEEPFPQNQEAAKRFKGNQKRKQPGSIAFSSTSTVIPVATSIHAGHPLLRNSSINPSNGFGSLDSSGNTDGRSTPSLVYQQPMSLQHQQLPAQYLPLNQTGRNGSSLTYANITNGSYPQGTTSPSLTSGSIPPETTTDDEMNALTAMLSETTLSSMAYYGPSAATILTEFDDDDLWGPQIRSTNTEDLVVPPEMRALPDLATRQHLTELYYKNHFILLPMVQRDVLRVCEENTHLPHCLLLCYAVYYCGSMFSGNTIPLRKDSYDESTVGEDFFQRGQALLDMKYLTTHICTIQSLLLFAIGHKSPAQRSGFISQAITMALDMGLHTKLDDSVNRFVRAYRARVFWCCFIFDSTSSAIGGKPTLINDEEIGVEMVELNDLGPENEYCSDQYLIHCVHGWKICRKIRKNSKLVLQRPPPSQEVLLENLGRLDRELVEWQERLPPVFDLVPAKGAITSDIKSLAAGAQLLCYALIILLHHPYLPNPKSPEAFQTPCEGGPPDSQGYCTQAAKEITKISGILLKEAPRSFEQNTPTRYALNFAIRIHLRNAKCTIDSGRAKESRKDLQKSMDYVEQVENLQFFRINRSKKSDVADLLASCRAALAQQKSSSDMAKEAAAVKHRQLLQAKLQAKEQLRQQQQQQQQQQQLLQLQQAQQAQQGLQNQSPQLQHQQQMQPQPQQPQQQSQQQMYIQQQHLHQQRAMQIAQIQAQEKKNFLQQQQQQLQMLRQQHQQQQFLHQQQQQQQRQVPSQQQRQVPSQQQRQVPSQHQQPMLQNSVLFQGQPTFGHPSVISNPSLDQFAQTSPQFSSTGLPNGQQEQRGSPQQQQQQQQQPMFATWMSNDGTSSLTGASQDLMLNSEYYNGNGGSSDDIIDIQAIAFDPRHEAMFSTAASNTYNYGNTPRVTHGGLVEDVFLTSIPRSIPSISSPATSMSSVSVQNADDAATSFSSPQSSEASVISSTAVSPMLRSMKMRSMQTTYSGSDNYNFNNNNNFNGSNFHSNGAPAAGAATSASSTPEIPSASIVSSPGSAGLLSEEAVLESFTGQMIHDTFYMHVNLPAEHPRNDPTSFVYLPSELEYGDTAALSPGGGESTNSSENDTMSPPPF
ncbi:fungal-specific transcription factor domain-containing protein [Dissophora ornata]|nr:fungal-specific transcription factor domain-containing protein [Dissophora ornata]